MAYLMQFGSMASYLWTSILAFTMQSLSTKLNWSLSIKKEIIYNIMVWGISSIPLILMFTQKLVGNAVIYCWIKDIGLYRFFYLYFPFGVMFIINIFCFIITIKKKKKIIQSMEHLGYIADSSDTISSIEETITLLRAVMIIQTFCWLPGILNRIADALKVTSFTLLTLQCICEPLEGTLNGIVYIYLMLRNSCQKNLINTKTKPLNGEYAFNIRYDSD